jgi:ArsR family transcriptional regulator, arsenate/arsenite/antimonite-responsive transcriptional repressor
MPVTKTKEPVINAVVFAKAIADETRQKIMTLCCCTRLTVSDITERMGVSQPTVSHHLAILRDAGLVNIEREGRETFYSLNQERITTCCGALLVQFAPTHAADYIELKASTC